MTLVDKLSQSLVRICVPLALMATLFSVAVTDVQAQEAGELADPEPLIEAVREQPADTDIAERIRSVFDQIEALEAVDVVVREGVVTLAGSVANDRQAQRALDLAIRLEGVVTVNDEIERTLGVQDNVMPLIDQLKSDLDSYMRALPLFVVALVTFFIIAYAGHLLARWSSILRQLAPNPFLAQLMAQAIRVFAVIVGLIVALNLVGATALMGAILGGAGVLGLAIGFAVRDTMENYISSIMLSLRQPFRANDHVFIGDHEGKVMRLTSRATVLMTLDGNHLRIPNSTVFKAVILNYTRNPERRFDFELGVDAADDPVAAMKTGLDAINKLEFVLDEPEPNAIITAVGDSNIVIRFMAWVDQSKSDFGKARSLAIRAAMTVLEDEGFTLPEPIYRLRFDQPIPQQPQATEMESAKTADSAPEHPQQSASSSVEPGDPLLDVSPDKHLEEKVNDERATDSEGDLLDQDRPIE